MKNLSLGASKSMAILLLLFLALIGVSFQEQSHDIRINRSSHKFLKKAAAAAAEIKEDLGMKLYPMGSSLPDCSHACGPCVPCKRVMVSYKCATESCPVVYRCMCKGKYYHVPSH